MITPMAAARPRSVLAAAGAMHFVHDGFSEILYVLLPVWAGEFRLSLWQVGFIRSAYTGGMAAFQIPAGLLAERLGERPLLMLGTLATALTDATSRQPVSARQSPDTPHRAGRSRWRRDCPARRRPS